MEAVIVLPIYLVLLGGLFMVGDIMRGRFVLQDSGRYEVWSTYTRFEMPDTASVFQFAEAGSAFHLERNENGEFSPYSTGFLYEDGQKANGNMWAYARIGLTRATVELPFWTAMFDVPRNGIGQEATPSRNRLHEDGATFCWAFDYHRISEAAIAERNGDPNVFRRSNPCASLQETSIVGDSHFGGAENALEPHGERKPYQRNPILTALGI